MENKYMSIFVIMVCVLVGLSKVMTQVCTGTTPTNPERIRTGEKLTDESFKKYHNVSSVYSCATLCIYLSRCNSFQFNTISRSCEMNQNHTGTGTIEADSDYVLSDISNWPTNIAGECNGRQCDINSTCVPTASTYVCIPY